jgi:cytochrome c1
VPGRRPSYRSLLLYALMSGAVALAVGGCAAETGRARPATPTPAGDPPPVRLTPAPNVAGDPENGRRLFTAAGCAGCHTLPSVSAATGVSGPVLANVVLRPTLAGEAIAMTPENMARWLLDPSALKPGTAMPSVGLTDQQARDITAFLYSQPYNP